MVHVHVLSSQTKVATEFFWYGTVNGQVHSSPYQAHPDQPCPTFRRMYVRQEKYQVDIVPGTSVGSCVAYTLEMMISSQYGIVTKGRDFPAVDLSVFALPSPDHHMQSPRMRVCGDRPINALLRGIEDHFSNHL